MTRWLIISAETGAQIGDAITSDEAPAAAAGQLVERCPEEWPELCEWSPSRRGFVDLIVATPLITVGRFKLLMTPEERIAIRAAASANPQIYDFLDVLNGFSSGVSLSDPLLIAGIAALEAAGLLSSARAAAILAGEEP